MANLKSTTLKNALNEMKDSSKIELSSAERKLETIKTPVTELKPVNTKTVNLAEGVRFGSVGKNFLDFSINEGITKIEYDFTGMSKDNLLEWVRELGERLKNVDKSFQIREKAAIEKVVNGVFKVDSSVVGAFKTEFRVEINPDIGGVDCLFFVEKPLTCSYTLERSEVLKKNASSNDKLSVVSKLPKTILSYKTLASSSRTTLNQIAGIYFNDNTAELGHEYTYRLKVNNLVDKTSSVYEKKIVYEKLNIEVIYFNAYPDSKKTIVKISCKLKNCSDFKIYRNDNKKDLTKSLVDENVVFDGKYQYVLEATNLWGKIKRVTDVEWSQVRLNANGASAVSDVYEKQVTLEWVTVNNALSYTVKRKNSSVSSWDEAKVIEKVNVASTKGIKNTSKSNGKYVDWSSDLEPDSAYDYDLFFENVWTHASVKVYGVKTKSRPSRPRMLHSDTLTCLKWTPISNASTYKIARFNNSAMCDLKGKPNVDFSVSSVKSSYNDNIAYDKDTLYTYRIIAHNGWGDSEPCYYDVRDCDFKKGENAECFKYAEQIKFCKYWNGNFQGITTDGDWWYITDGVPGGFPTLRKASVDETLDRALDSNYPVPDRYHTHVGDLDCFKDYLFVPVYKDSNGDRGEIWIFDKNTLERLTTVKLLKKDGSPVMNVAWCAVNPIDERLYTSEKNISSVFSFKIEFDKIRSSGDVFPKESACEVCLYDENGNSLKKESMQGGCFDYFNNLYLNSGYGSGKANEGIHVFKLVHDENQEIKNIMKDACGDSSEAELYEAYRSRDLSSTPIYSRAVLLAKSSQGGLFNYQFDSSGDICGNFPEEPEGLVYYDFFFAHTAKIPPVSDKATNGSFHACLLLNAAQDDLCIKHYEHLYRETRERNVYYSSSNLKVVEKNGCKVLDNGTLIKKFNGTGCDSIFANNTMSVLKEIDCCKIYTFGWLETSSPYYNYDYVFSAGVRDQGITENDYGQVVVSYNPSQFDKVKIKDLYNHERYEIRLEYGDGKESCYFFAHNSTDASRIIELLKKYRRLCYIGVGPDNYWKRRFRAENNFMWLEDKIVE